MGTSAVAYVYSMEWAKNNLLVRFIGGAEPKVAEYSGATAGRR
jgi:hypothetical protein